MSPEALIQLPIDQSSNQSENMSVNQSRLSDIPQTEMSH